MSVHASRGKPWVANTGDVLCSSSLFSFCSLPPRRTRKGARPIETGTRFSINVEALFLNAFNHPNYLIGNAFAENGTDVNITSTTFGQSTTMAATNAAASARNVQLRVQINF